MKTAIIIIWSILLGLVLAASLPLAYKFAFLLLPLVFLFFVIKPFHTIMLLLIIRPELELFRESGLLRFFSVVPIALLFVFICIKKFHFCWKKLKFLYIFVFVCILSLVFSINFRESLVYILKLLAMISIYVITFNFVETKEDAMKLLYCFPLAMIIPLLIGIKQFLLGQTYVTPGSELERVEGLFILANSFSRFLFVTLFASIPLFYYRKKKNVFFIILMLFTVIFIILLKIRGVFFTMIIAFMLLFYFTPKIRKYFWIIIPALFLLVIPIGLKLSQHLIDPLESKVYGGEPFYWRLAIWKQLFLRVFLQKPILGFGSGTSLDVGGAYTDFLNYPHNDYLRILIENGIVGLIFYLAFFLSNLKLSYREIKFDANRYFNVCAFILIFATMFMSLAANIFYGLTYLWYFFSFLAVTHKLNVIENLEINRRK